MVWTYGKIDIDIFIKRIHEREMSDSRYTEGVHGKVDNKDLMVSNEVICWSMIIGSYTPELYRWRLHS